MICKGCLVDKEVNQFELRKDRNNKPRNYCKDCYNNLQQVRYLAHKRNAPFKAKCTKTKARAKALNVPFNLTPEYLESIWTGTCPVTGLEIKLFDCDRTDELAAELDRFVPELGYVKGNVTFLSRKINRIKNNCTVAEIKLLAKWMENESRIN